MHVLLSYSWTFSQSLIFQAHDQFPHPPPELGAELRVQDGEGGVCQQGGVQHALQQGYQAFVSQYDDTRSIIDFLLGQKQEDPEDTGQTIGFRADFTDDMGATL